MNRRIRNRTYGGVGGRRAQARLLPDRGSPVGSDRPPRAWSGIIRHAARTVRLISAPYFLSAVARS